MLVGHQLRSEDLQGVGTSRVGLRSEDKEEGHVPLPDDFLKLMKARRERSPSRLIFPGTSGKTEAHFLRVLKRLAFRAGLNCGNCFDI
jgi:hypothetical protein